MDQSMDQSMDQPINQSISQPVSWPASWPLLAADPTDLGARRPACSRCASPCTRSCPGESWRHASRSTARRALWPAPSCPRLRAQATTYQCMHGGMCVCRMYMLMCDVKYWSAGTLGNSVSPTPARVPYRGCAPANVPFHGLTWHLPHKNLSLSIYLSISLSLFLSPFSLVSHRQTAATVSPRDA